jgi:hypothetical protein
MKDLFTHRIATIAQPGLPTTDQVARQHKAEIIILRPGLMNLPGQVPLRLLLTGVIMVVALIALPVETIVGTAAATGHPLQAVIAAAAVVPPLHPLRVDLLLKASANHGVEIKTRFL